MTSGNPSSLPIEENEEESKSELETTEHLLPWRRRNKSQTILVHKLRNIQEFATAYDLDLSNDDDRSLKTDIARENVQRMANDLLTSIEEANKLNLGSFVSQMAGSQSSLLSRSRIQTLHQELMEVMPAKWKEIFEQRQEQTS